MHCPPMDKNLPDGCIANFAHIAELYEMESTMPQKKAHSLRQAALNPKNIEKTSTKLALSVFCEPTRDALQFYCDYEGRTTWQGTADFLPLVIKLWNVLNVKIRSKGRRNGDLTMDPVRSSVDWKLQFLREFAGFLERLQQSGQPGLTCELHASDMSESR